MMSEEKNDTESAIPWKRKTYFPEDVCGVKDCQETATGYMTAIRKKRLWWGPVCEACAVKYTTHKPYDLQSLAVQRKGVEDLASILDIPVEEAARRLREAKIDDKGRPLQVVERAVEEIRERTSEIVQTDDPSIERAQAAAVIPRSTLEKALREGELLLQKLGTFEVHNQQAMDLLGNIVRTVKAQHTTLENQRKELVAPFNDGKKAVQDAFNPPLKLLDRIEARLKLLILEGQRRMQEAQDAALLAAQTAYQQGDTRGAALATQQVQATAVSMPQGVSTRMIIDFEVVDITQIPRQFFVLDEAAIKHALAAGLDIPGVRRIDRQIASVRA